MSHVQTAAQLVGIAEDLGATAEAAPFEVFSVRRPAWLVIVTRADGERGVLRVGPVSPGHDEWPHFAPLWMKHLPLVADLTVAEASGRVTYAPSWDAIDPLGEWLAAEPCVVADVYARYAGAARAARREAARAGI